MIATEMYSLGIDRLRRRPIGFETAQKGNEVFITIRDLTLTDRGGFRNLYEFIIAGDGKMTIRHRVNPEGTMPLWLPRIGLTLTLDKNLNRIDWYGRGPQENYPDRKTGYRIGCYHSTIQDMYEPYLIPQDHGLRTDNRWVRLTDSQGAGLQFSMNELFNFNTYPYSTDNLTKATYTYQLQEQDGFTFNLDYATSGVGCTARGIFEAYRVAPQVFERIITIQPVKR